MLSDEEILRLWRSGNRRERARAFEALAERELDHVLSFCCHMMGDDSAAHDVTNDTFLQAQNDFDEFTGKGTIHSWLLGIANHRCLDAIRGRLRSEMRHADESAADDLAGGGDVTESVDQRRLIEALCRCLERLPEQTRATLLMRFTEDLTYQEMEAPLGAHAPALQARVSRALPLLRRCLKERGLGL